MEEKKKRIDENPDLFRKRTKQYYQNHKEELCAYQKVRRETHTETQQAVYLARREARREARTQELSGRLAMVFAEREARAKERARRQQTKKTQQARKEASTQERAKRLAEREARAKERAERQLAEKEAHHRAGIIFHDHFGVHAHQSIATLLSLRRERLGSSLVEMSVVRRGARDNMSTRIS